MEVAIQVINSKKRYFLLKHFTGDCVSIQMQDKFMKGIDCDVIVTCSSDSKMEPSIQKIVEVHSQVFSVWSRKFKKIIRRSCRVVSPEEPFQFCLSSHSIESCRLVAHLIYFGSVNVFEKDVERFTALRKELKIKVKEINMMSTPCMKKLKKGKKQKLRFEVMTPSILKESKKFPRTPFIWKIEGLRWTQGKKNLFEDKLKTRKRIMPLEEGVYPPKKRGKYSPPELSSTAIPLEDFFSMRDSSVEATNDKTIDATYSK